MKIKKPSRSIIREIIQWIIVIILFFLFIVVMPCISVKGNTNEGVVAGASIVVGDCIVNYQEGLALQEQLEREALIVEQKRLEAEAAEQARLEMEAKAEQVRLNNIQQSSDFRYMCAIIWAEARGESLEGKKAVGIVVMNRVASSDWPNSIYEVIYQKGQFQPTWNGQMDKGLAHFDNGSIEEDIKQAALYAIEGNKTIEYGSTIDMSWAIFFNSHTTNANFVIGGHQFK